ncbi:MAG TPA: Ig-like domain-containing protein [Steroidobacteraceae bacterium]|nr:Ig-like domain-containing protein [Steroidobacteraceae bacterium]
MITIQSPRRQLMLCSAALVAVLTGCDATKDPILGGGDVVLGPSVTLSSPASAATGVSTSAPGITATFSEPVDPITGGASFVITCAAPCVSPTGSVALDSAGRVATYTPSASLQPMTLYTATVTGARSVATDLVMLTPRTWTFTTGALPDATRPMVTATAPATSSPIAAGQALNTAVTASFTEDMAPSSLTAAGRFTLTCTTPCVSPTGTVSYSAASRAAVFTPNAALTASTVYTARVAATATDVAGNGLAGNQAAPPAASDYVWTFRTGTTTDVTRPGVTLTAPVTSTPGPNDVPTNGAIVATFSESMLPATVNAAGTFVVTCTSPCVTPTGSVSYAVASNTAVFTPAAALASATTYTARVTTAAKDLAGNALAGNQGALPAASDHVWSFTTAGAAPAANISVFSTSPGTGATGACPSTSTNATFTLPSGLRLDPGTVHAATFTLTGPAMAAVSAASVTVDAGTGRVATFTPQAPLVSGSVYTATLKGGVTGIRDLALPGNGMLADYSWSFTAGPATGSCLITAPQLATAAPYGTFGGSAGMTNTGILTVVNGDIGTIATDTSAITGFHDTAGDIYTESPANRGTVNGKIYTCTNSTTGPTAAGVNAAACNAATQARLDAEIAYLALAAMPAGANPGGNLAGLTLAPGVYTAPAGSFLIEGGDLTLDAQGNANAVWVFQMATTLTVGGPGAAAPQSIILAGGAQARNVFWQVGTAATINAGGGGTMVGTIISQAGATFSTFGNVAIVTLEGRALSLGASVTVVNTVINVPGP